MKMAFDIDGVAVNQDLVALREIDLCTDPEKRKALNYCYYINRLNQINLYDYLSAGDELYLITGRNLEFAAITKKWQEKYYPNAHLIMTNHSMPTPDTNIQDWLVEQAKVKAKVLNNLGIDVYFEDTPEVVEVLRNLCKNTKVIQYGSRF